MANPEHLARLKEGVPAWNQWRRETPDLIPNLNEADLRGANLTLANLSWASLFGANLVGANLSEALLYQANLSRANLERSDLNNALLAFTVFGDSNLTAAKNLEYCRHAAPSIIDHLTLAQSGLLSLKFLRSCGLPDSLVEYLPSLLNQPIQFYSCFISYSTKDQEFADRLYADLQNRGVRCWFAPEDLKIGDPFRQRIEEAIRIHDRLLLILSENSVQSDWVREEVESCLEREHREKQTVLFPVRLDDAVMDASETWAASIRRQRHIGDFRRWKDHDSYVRALSSLTKDLSGLPSDRQQVDGGGPR
ncbi:MAG TPA: toll/interleukin-1 receptor domain-containing protein [Bryobacteraceae bacterium]|nr:toll/interleukin-1 receptor domain-containing protein [Bryobacteraceae bacterium]